MATGSDQAIGAGLMGLGSFIFLYYTIWVVILPFVETDHVVQKYFPDRMYAVLIPIVAGIFVLFLVGAFISVVLLKKRSEKKTN